MNSIATNCHHSVVYGVSGLTVVVSPVESLETDRCTIEPDRQTDTVWYARASHPEPIAGGSLSLSISQIIFSLERTGCVSDNINRQPPGSGRPENESG